MRFRRLILPLLAAVAMTAAMLTTPAPSSASHQRPVSVYAGEIRNTGTFWAKGRARGWSERYVYLQKQTNRGARYRTIKADRTGTGGAFYFKFGGRIGDCFRIFVPAGGSWGKVYKSAGCIVRD